MDDDDVSNRYDINTIHCCPAE